MMRDHHWFSIRHPVKHQSDSSYILAYSKSFRPAFKLDQFIFSVFISLVNLCYILGLDGLIGAAA